MNNQTHQKNQKENHKKEQVLKTLASLIPQFKQAKVSQLKLQRMAGITNQTYKATHPCFEKSLIYRKFGDSQDNLFLNREIQQFVYQYISDNKIGPKIYGMAKDIRIQEFLESSVLKTTDMLEQKPIQSIAFALRKFHELDPKDKIIKRQSLYQQTFFSEGSPILGKCLSKIKKTTFTAEQQKILQQLKHWVSQEQIEFIRKTIKQDLSSQKLVFSHNDLLPGNVLIRKGDQKIIFIDYEYSCFNYRVYDIANYFNQCILDYEVKNPPFFKLLNLGAEKQKMMDKFIQCYALADEPSFDKYIQNIKNNIKMNQTQLKIYYQVKQYIFLGRMLSDMTWGYWAIIVSKNPNINFDYIAFAKTRHEMYQSSKQKYLKSKNQGKGKDKDK